MDYNQLHLQYKEESLYGRYITLKDIKPLLDKYTTEVIGHSVLGKPIYKYSTGNGPTRVFMWSQMHGNESTTTKALFDFLNLLQSDEPLAEELLAEYTFCFLPMVNPDGAERYTRVNANEIDLNRDSETLSQPESQLLRQTFDSFKPDYCYNLHDQRSIFGAGTDGFPATVSFLAPAFNEARDINDVRIKAMNRIVAMNEELQKHIPNQVGRFDDSFNSNCIGDKFTSLNVPTILFEAGHFQNDYEREITRKMIFIALVSGLRYRNENVVVDNKKEEYLNINQNNIVFYDFIYKNVKIYYDGKEIITNFVAQYKEELIDGKIQFNAYIVEIGELIGFYGHYQYDANNKAFTSNGISTPIINQKADFTIGTSTIFVNGIKI
ncbi:M14 metallopeptidase family protein [Flavobacterium sp. SUN046]|uniref:M14 family metallopeptidase n=1 Tax=Flavobacterium sp. SUN046 TaxID=3002440 RepID=UPI002DBC3B88|nr:M14 metallopeptidase family protein [Flavobacterium sp. SUN046]MEC4049087.1 M14 metallopeptidase family protein [Flavobacterium sp. SUN046]